MTFLLSIRFWIIVDHLLYTAYLYFLLNICIFSHTLATNRYWIFFTWPIVDHSTDERFDSTELWINAWIPFLPILMTNLTQSLLTKFIHDEIYVIIYTVKLFKTVVIKVSSLKSAPSVKSIMKNKMAHNAEGNSWSTAYITRKIIIFIWVRIKRSIRNGFLLGI